MKLYLLGLGCRDVRAPAQRGSIDTFVGQYLSNCNLHAQGVGSTHDQQLLGQKLKNLKVPFVNLF